MSDNPFGNVIRYSWVAVLAAVAVYLGCIGFSRMIGNARMASRIQAAKARPFTDFSLPQGSDLTILQFYGDTWQITEGEHVVICYGVQNARAVRIDPAVEELSPAFNRCIAAWPEKTTTYTLIATGVGDAEVRASFTVRVKPARPFIFMLATSEKEIRRGQPFSFCYGVKWARAARLDPMGIPLPAPTERACLRMYPVASMNYKLLATGDGGRDVAKFSVVVH